MRPHIMPTMAATEMALADWPKETPPTKTTAPIIAAMRKPSAELRVAESTPRVFNVYVYFFGTFLS